LARLPESLDVLRTRDEAALRTARLDARDLEDPVAISIQLLDRLLRAMSNGVSWNPLTK
jgi:hypothetical protein